jgi:hypothetical protein
LSPPLPLFCFAASRRAGDRQRYRPSFWQHCYTRVWGAAAQHRQEEGCCWQESIQG